VQVFVNLLTNAAKYTPPGGHLELSARRDAGTVAVEVSDDGQGIAPELLPRVFDLFVQGPRGIARSEGGLGLGLAIVRSVVEQHGGRIDARSDGTGKGSTFRVELPLTPEHPRAAGDTREKVGPQGSMRVLVVDDNGDAAETLADVLRCSGYEVRTAPDAVAALSAAAEFRPEVAVIDIGLPVMDGWTLGAKLRDLGPLAPECIAVTGYGSDDDRARSRQAGFVAHLVKPLQAERLERILAGIAAARDRSGG
jgi:CheY-like chemotaxis protein